MQVSKLITALCILLLIVACSTGSLSQSHIQTNTHSNTTGRIVFPVLGEQFMGKRSNTSIGVEVILKNQKTGQVHKSLMEFKEGKRVEVMSNLAPGVYVIDEYNELMGGLFARQLKPAVEIVVEAGRTVLSPVFVYMVAHIYPRSGLGGDDYWDGYR